MQAIQSADHIYVNAHVTILKTIVLPLFRTEQLYNKHVARLLSIARNLGCIQAKNFDLETLHL